MIKYIGSKRVLVPALVEAIRALPQTRRVLDVFSGTARVGHALKAAGLDVVANDHNAYAHTLATCYVQADAEQHAEPARALLAELGTTPPRAGWFTETFCVRSRFFHPDNGARIEAIRERIETLALAPELRAIALVSLMEAADRVDSTTGVQMAYLKQWAPRALGMLELRLPKLLSGQGLACGLDALAFAQRHTADVAYLDPPYNQHSYLGNYHVWETLIRWDRPEVYGVACKRIDCRERASAYNRKREIVPALTELLHALDVRHIVLSFSNEGHIPREQLLELLAAHGDVAVLEIPHTRYVGARIGIYNPRGEKVGRIGHLDNVEYLFTVRRRVERRRAS